MKPRSKQSLLAERAFYERVAELGGMVLEAGWLGVSKRHRIQCAEGHVARPLPSLVNKGGGICRTCSRRDPADAWTRFQARIAELGGVLLEDRWLGNDKPYRIRCKDGHESAPRAQSVLAGQGICPTCAGRDPVVAEQKFRAYLAQIGAVLVEERWLGGGKPHRVICPAGHPTTVRPSGIRRHAGFCRTCAGNDPKAAEREFHERIQAAGGTVLEPSWLGAAVPHRIRCASGHEGMARPANVKSRGSICRTCARRDPQLAEANFRKRVAELGGVVLEERWLGADSPHRVRCSAGHERAVRPSRSPDRGLCLTCARRDPARAESEFRARVRELGGEVLEPKWLGANEPHRIRCIQGHVSSPRPTGVQQGNGICRYCMGRIWDAFYVVVNDAEDVLKFGITSGDPRPRLKRHESRGFERVVRVITDLPMGTALALELAVKATLRLARMQPVRGTEYFPLAALATVLDIVDHYPVRPKPVPLRIPVQMAFDLGLPAA